MPPRVRVHPQQALAVYAEPLAAGRRVVVFADAEVGLAERLDELGAAAVVLFTPGDDLDQLRAARFDLAIVADLALFDDPAAVLAAVRRLVGESGAALVAAPNRDAAEAADTGALDYYALFDLVAREFADVRMIAQLPFHGVALAEVGDEDESPVVSVDTQLADADRAPQAFVALASQRGTSLDPYAIVELPAPTQPLLDDAEEPAERLPVDVLHDEHALVLARDDVDRADDVRVPDARHEPGLVDEHRREAPIASEVRVHALDGDRRARGLLVGATAVVDRRHPAGRDLPLQPVPTDDRGPRGSRLRHDRDLSR